VADDERWILKNHLAVNMLVLNGATVLRRCLFPLRGVIDELVVVDSGSTDDTQHVLEDLAIEMKLDRFYYERIHPYSNHFFTDEAETWKMPMPGPFTGRRILKDWAMARNKALDNTHADYVLKLDADDEPISPPENWLRTVACLDERPHVSVVAAPYEIFDGQGKISWLSMYDRMWRRVPVEGDRPLRWVMSCHEYLSVKTCQNTLYTAQGLRVRDWRDSPGAGVRVAHRNLKVLLWDHEHGVGRRLQGQQPSSNMVVGNLVKLFTLAHEAAEVFPEFAIEILDEVSSKVDPLNVGMLSDCRYHRGRALQAMGQDDAAVAAYEEADEIAPHTQALLLARELIVRSMVSRRETGVDTNTARAAHTMHDRILARVGAESAEPVGSATLESETRRVLGSATLPFNCDLGLVAKVRGNSG
jgi:hypothetical protein